MKLWMRRIALGLLGLLVVVALVALWLLHSSSGARLALGMVGGLKTESVEGSLAGPLVLNGLSLQVPGVDLSARRLELDPQLWPLLSGRVKLDLLRSDGLKVRITPTPTSPPPDDPAPLDLPKIELSDIQLLDTRIEGFSDDPIELTSLSGALRVGGQQIWLEKLALEAPQGKFNADGEFNLAEWSGRLLAKLEPTLGPEPFGEINLDLDSDGQQAQLKLTLPGDAGVFSLQIDELKSGQRFVAQLNSPGLELSRFGLPGNAPLPPIEMTISGDRHGAKFEGGLTYLGQAWRLDGTELAWSAESLRLMPLHVQRVAGGELNATGEIGLKDNRAELKFSIGSLPIEPFAGPSVGDLELIEGGFELTGSVLDWRLTGPAHFTRDNVDLRVKLDLAGNNERLSIEDFTLLASYGEHPLGVLTSKGTLAPAEPHALALDTTLEEFDTSSVLPDWPGSVSLVAKLSGDLRSTIAVQLDSLSGELREAKLSGAGDLTVDLAGGLPRGELQLQWGGNALQLNSADAASTALKFTLEQPQLLDPGLAGRLTGTAQVDAQRQEIELDLEGQALALGDMRVASLQLAAKLGSAADAPVRTTLRASGVQLAGRLIEELNLTSTGLLNAHQFQFGARSAEAELKLGARGSWSDNAWSGEVQQLELLPGKELPEAWRARTWSLEQPVPLRYAAAGTQLGLACLASSPARLCLGGDYRPDARSELQFQLASFPLELSRVFLEPAGVVLEGSLDGSGQLGLEADGRSSGTLELHGTAVELLLLTTDTPTRFKLSTFTAVVQPDAAGVPMAKLNVQIDKLGSLQLDSGLSGSPALLTVDFSTLEALDGLSEMLLKPRGVLKGQLRREGETMSGEIRLSKFSAELPAAGLKLRDSEISLNGAPDRILIDGKLNSGAGLLLVTGNFNPSAGLAGLDLALTGERFLAADLPQLKLYVSPKLNLLGQDGELRIKGELGIPEGVIDLARFEPAVGVSADVVIVDQPQVEQAASAPLRADVSVILGDQVSLKGFGLDGKVAGRLSVRERPGRQTTARGEIQVRGTYKAYGQDLTIERGKLLFANSGLDNPGLDIRAVRTIGAIKAGVQVRGSADFPQLTVYSEPSMDQLNTISYLVLGRPASEASGGASGAAVQNAAQQLGGNLLAKSIGQKLGLEVGIESSAELGASAFSVGKYLSPRLFVGYGRSLYEQLQLFIVRYKLSDRYELEATSGREQKIGANYRWEK